MPNIYDNIEAKILDGLTDAFTADQTQRADICVGYINLRGWRCIADAIDRLPGDDGKPPCRLIVGMPNDSLDILRMHYTHQEKEATHAVINERLNQFKRYITDQLVVGTQSNIDQTGLLAFAEQLRKRTVVVRFFGEHRLHAKLYLAYRNEKMVPITGFVGSSNLTYAGVQGQGELNVDVVEQDAAKKLADWFENRWDECDELDITDKLADIIENSWVKIRAPYEIYIKTAYELSKQARAGVHNFPMPEDFDNILLPHQRQAVALAAERLTLQGGVIIGDVVGLGKTLTACAIAKILDDDLKYNTLIICPARLTRLWEEHREKYRIHGRVLSLGKVNTLDEVSRHQLVIIDESHNLRNREAQRYKHVLEYLKQSEARVMLLTATPYNKQYNDIASQLRLFVPPNADLGIRPDAHIKKCGEAHFAAQLKNAPNSSLVAFEKSEEIEDWRDLIGMFMLRRTRKHIIDNYAEKDDDGKPFLRYADNSRFYFPKRIAECQTFAWRETDKHDQYALLYSNEVVNIISDLNLPRYGVGEYLLQQYASAKDVDPEYKNVIGDLARAGKRLIGFARSNLYKRLESCGPAFLLSLQRHIVRNAVYLIAIEQNGELPTGDVFEALDNEQDEESQDDFLGELLSEDGTLDAFKQRGEYIYQVCKSSDKNRRKFKWLPVSFFKSQTLYEELQKDCEALMKVLRKVPQWDPSTDRKLDALVELCTEKHGGEKVLVFTEYKDTAKYLYEQFCARGIADVGRVFGGIKNIEGYVRRFSPNSNGQLEPGESELRVLLTTDTLSEGQNLQDSHIIINFDLPWTIIRLVQRAGRVDRIGQKSPEVLCYSFLPEKGIEKIISLRERLQTKIGENAEVVGSEEKFFEGDKVNLQNLYEGKINLEYEDEETDLVSRAFNIWQQAIADDPALKERIENLPDVVYSGKRAAGIDSGTIAYIKTAQNQSVLMQLDDAGKVVSQSQSKILADLTCEPDTPPVRPPKNHHDIVAAGIKHVRKGRARFPGALGDSRSLQHRAYGVLQQHRQGEIEVNPNANINELGRALELIYAHPLTDEAKAQLRRHLRLNTPSYEIVKMVVALYKAKRLCDVSQSDNSLELRIICSMSLVK